MGYHTHFFCCFRNLSFFWCLLQLLDLFHLHTYKEPNPKPAIKNCSLFLVRPKLMWYLLLGKVQNSITEVSTFNYGTSKITPSQNRSNKHSICEVGLVQNLHLYLSSFFDLTFFFFFFFWVW